MEEFNRRRPKLLNQSLLWPPVGKDPRHFVNRSPIFRQAGPDISGAPEIEGVLEGWSGITGAWSLSRQLVTGPQSLYYSESGGNLVSLFDQSRTGVGTAKDIITSGTHPVITAGLNSIPCIDKAKDTSYLLCASGTRWSDFITASDYYLLAALIIDDVIRDSATVYSNELVIGDAQQNFGIYLRGFGPLAYSFSWDGTVDAAAHAFFRSRIVIFEAYHTGGNTFIRLNGGTAVSVAAGDLTASLSAINLRFLGRGSANDSIDGKLFELIVANTLNDVSLRDTYIADLITHIGEAALPNPHLFDVGKLNDTGTDATVTFAYNGIGIPQADRKLICGVSMMDAASVFSLNSALLAGVAGNVTAIDSNQTLAALVSADEATLHTGSFVGTASESITNDQMGQLVAAYGLAAGAPAASGTNVVASGTQITLTLANAGFTAGMVVFITAAKRASATAFDGISDDGNSVNAWVELENSAPPDGGARLGMWYKIFEASEVGTDVIVTITGGAVATEFAAVYNRFAPA